MGAAPWRLHGGTCADPHAKKSQICTNNNSLSLCLGSAKETAAAYLKISEGHKLDDVSGGDVPPGRGQQFVITVKELHLAEVRPSHTHDNDRHGQTRGLHDSSACLVHVCDHTVCDDEQHKVLLQMNRAK